MRAGVRAAARRGRWKYRKLRWRWRRRLLRLRQAFFSPLGMTSLAFFPFVLAMAASAALMGSEARSTGAGTPADLELRPTVSEAAVERYGELRLEVVRAYAVRYRVPMQLAGLIHETALVERIDPGLAFRLVRVESSFRPQAVGPAGSVGLAQVKPSTARWLDSTVTRERLFEAETNLRLGFRYLRMLLNVYGHDTRLALLAYNRGPGTVAGLLALGEDPGNGYASRVLGTTAPPARGPAPAESEASGPVGHQAHQASGPAESEGSGPAGEESPSRPPEAVEPDGALPEPDGASPDKESAGSS